MASIKITLNNDEVYSFPHTGKHIGKTNRIEYETGYVIVVDEQDKKHKFLVSDIFEVISLPAKNV